MKKTCRKGHEHSSDKCPTCRKAYRATPAVRAREAAYKALPETKVKAKVYEARARLKMGMRPRPVRGIKYLASVEGKSARNRYGFMNYLRKFYSLTIEDFARMIASQQFRCAICRDPLQLDTKRMVQVDHCHATGKIRGVLCQPCNIGLGGFRDNPRSLQGAISYLKLDRTI